jgi:cell division protein FtsB
MPAIYWLALTVCTALVIGGSIKGYNVYADFKAAEAERARLAAEEAQLEADIAKLDALIQAAVIDMHKQAAGYAVAAANTADLIYIPSTRTLH